MRTDLQRYHDASVISQSGWWESNLTTRQFLFSENIGQLLGLKGNTISFDDFLGLLREDYREKIKYEFYEYSLFRRNYYEQTLPLLTTRGEVWIKVHAGYYIDEADGGGSFGSLQVVPSKETEAETTQIESDYNILHQIDVVTRFLSDFLSDKKEDVIIRNILQTIQDYYNADSAYLFEFNNDETQSCIYNYAKGDAVDMEKQYAKFPNSMVPWCTEQILSGRPVIISELKQLPHEAVAEYKVFQSQGIKSLMVVPLVADKRIWGYIGINVTERVHNWSNEDYLWIFSLSNIISICINLSRVNASYKKQQRYQAHLIDKMPMGYGTLLVDN
jgi:hypothetical protein